MVTITATSALHPVPYGDADSRTRGLSTTFRKHQRQHDALIRRLLSEGLKGLDPR